MSRRTLRVLGLMLVLAITGSAFVANADAKKYSKAQKKAISKQLMRAVKKNPNVISKRWFLKKASVVSFTLPTTIRLLPASNQTGGHVNNDDARLQNSASLDLGPSLGTRSIGLGGQVHANINFNDAFDGGNLGDVRLSIPADSSKLSSTAVPLLANPNTSDVGHPAPEAELQTTVFATAPPAVVGTPVSVTAGTNTTTFSYNPATLETDLTAAVAGLNESCVGPPPVGGCPNNVYVAVAPGPNPLLGLPANTAAAVVTWTGAKAGVNQPLANITGPAVALATAATNDGNDPAPDADGNTGCGGFKGNNDPLGRDIDHLDKLTVSRDPGSNDNLGPGPSYGGSSNVQDTVLRTGALSIGVATPGSTVSIPGDNSGGPGTGINTIKLGANGGRANLFGNPVNGLASGNSVDVTLNLTTDINSIARQVDGQWPRPAGGGTAGEPTGNISANFFCRQAWTGKVTNYLTGINLVGNLKISPAITADGKVRIAKVNLHSKTPSKQALAACLSPYQLLMSGNPLINAVPGTDPFTVAPQLVGGAFNPLYVLYGARVGQSQAPGADCNAPGGPLDRVPFGVSPIPGGSGTGLEKLLTSGAAVGVSGDLDVTRVRAEVLIGNL